MDLPGADGLPWIGETETMLDEIEEFVTGVRRGPDADHALATVLFTDIVGSTARVATLGDVEWRKLLEAHHDAVRRNLELFGGHEVNTTGDGFLSTFDGPARAIRCAIGIRDSARSLGVEIRAGLHTGEVQMIGSDAAGLTVHVGARVTGLAQAGEVLVSASIPPLVVGADLDFADRGVHELKGVTGTWRLFSVMPRHPVGD